MKILKKIFSSSKSSNGTKNYSGSAGIIGAPLKKNSKIPNDLIGKEFYQEINYEPYFIDSVRVNGNHIDYNVYGVLLGRKVLVASPQLPLGNYTPSQLFDHFARHKFY